MNKKKLIPLLSAVALVGVIGVGSTLAYFTDNDAANNVVTMGHVNIELDEPEFSAANEDNTITYEFRYYEIVNGKVEDKDQDVVLEPLFTQFTAPTKLTGTDLKTIEGFEIKVIGHAIQAVGFKDAEEAWNAFDAEIDGSNEQGGE